MSRWAWLAAASALACGPDRPPWEVPPIVWSGEHLEYAPQDGAYEPCAGTLPYMDRYAELAAEAMGVQLDEPLVYIHGTDEDEVPCTNQDALACTRSTTIYSLVAPQEHELVHAVRGSQGFSHRFFEEGAAEAFGDDAHMPMRVRADGDLLEGIASVTREDGLPIEWYPRAGHFAAFLHDQYGPEVTTALLKRTDRDTSVGQAIAVLEESTGVPFDELRQDYEHEPTCGQARYRYPLFACEQPVDLRARCDETVTLAEPIRIECDDPGTIGPRDGEIWTYLALEVEQDGEYLVTAFDPMSSFSRLEIKECALGCDSILHEQRHGFDPYGIAVQLRAGRYSVKLLRHEDYPGEVEVKVEGRGCG